ncbi:hypothetical protein F5Y06DRAFT_296666 [Hypoxylon sp. FL0890]|nr:hypothetical protein F5Y06DRAFT_296666 [Hypoxylon sp. FL0890]
MSSNKPQESQMVSKVAASTLKRIVSHVEVERKFNPGPKFTSLLTSYTWPSLQRQHQSVNHKECAPFAVIDHPTQLIRDIYYDTEDGHLSTLGLWVRQRTVSILPLNPDLATASDEDKGEWNAKLRLGGYYRNSQFVEYDGKIKVSEEVLRITNSKVELEDLQVVSDLQTRRIEWEVMRLADGTAPPAKMTIIVDEVTEAGKNVVDESSFNHTVGEVELFQEVVTDDKDDGEHEAYRKEIAVQRMRELEEFMLASPDLFCINPSPIGKLSAYETWRAVCSLS